jgi:hypothetical protein
MHWCYRSMGWRRFMSPAEELERLHDDLDQLKKEITGVEARIREPNGSKCGF